MICNIQLNFFVHKQNNYGIDSWPWESELYCTVAVLLPLYNALYSFLKLTQNIFIRIAKVTWKFTEKLNSTS